MKITLYRTKVYLRSVSQLSKQVDMTQVEESIARDPLKWPIIRGTGGIRKARFGIGQKGKSGGGRICYFYLLEEGDIYLLKAYPKNVQENLTPMDKEIVKQIKETRKWKT